MGDVIRLRREMRKDELIDHLNADHFKRPIAPHERRGWTKESLADTHRLSHLGLGASADHRHGSR